MIHYAASADPVGPGPMVETRAMPLSTEAINQVLNSIVEHAVPSV